MLLSRYVIQRKQGTKTGEKVKLPVSELAKNSNSTVSCKCNECNVKYLQRFSRDKEICGSCRTKIRMTGNKHGEVNAKYEAPDKKELEKLFFEEFKGDSHAAKKYNVTIPVVHRWRKEYGIKLDPYHGRITRINKNEFKNDCKSLTYKELTKKYNNTGTIIRYAKKYNIELPETQFDIWENERKQLSKKASEIFKLNENGHNLPQIAEKLNLKYTGRIIKVFDQYNKKVIKHSYNQSKGEKEIREIFPNFKSVMFGKKYEIDCYDENLKLGIEYCGEYWHSDLHKNRSYHFDKWKFFKDNGIELITIFEHEWQDEIKKNILLSIINYKMGNIKNKYMARKLDIKEVDKSEAMKFYNNNHISGSRGGLLHIGLYENDILLSCLTIGKNRFGNGHELIRFCNKINCSVIGGFSRLLKHAIEILKPEQLISFADLRFGFGNVYKQSGFNFECFTTPNYWYYNHKNPQGFESRIKYQKHKLKDKLDKYNEELSEHKNMVLNGFLKIWDCGNSKWILNKTGEI